MCPYLTLEGGKLLDGEQRNLVTRQHAAYGLSRRHDVCQLSHLLGTRLYSRDVYAVAPPAPAPDSYVSPGLRAY